MDLSNLADFPIELEFCSEEELYEIARGPDQGAFSGMPSQMESQIFDPQSSLELVQNATDQLVEKLNTSSKNHCKIRLISRIATTAKTYISGRRPEQVSVNDPVTAENQELLINWIRRSQIIVIGFKPIKDSSLTDILKSLRRSRKNLIREHTRLNKSVSHLLLEIAEIRQEIIEDLKCSVDETEGTLDNCACNHTSLMQLFYRFGGLLVQSHNRIQGGEFRLQTNKSVSVHQINTEMQMKTQQLKQLYDELEAVILSYNALIQSYEQSNGGGTNVACKQTQVPPPEVDTFNNAPFTGHAPESLKLPNKAPHAPLFHASPIEDDSIDTVPPSAPKKLQIDGPPAYSFDSDVAPKIQIQPEMLLPPSVERESPPLVFEHPQEALSQKIQQPPAVPDPPTLEDSLDFPEEVTRNAPPLAHKEVQDVDISELRLSLLMEIRNHIGARVSKMKFTGNNSFLGRKWFENLYGDGGYCADFVIYALHTLGKSIDCGDCVPRDLGLARGTYRLFSYAAGNNPTGVNTLRPNGFELPELWVPGDIVIMSGDPNTSLEATEPFNGHTATVLNVAETPDQPGIFEVTTLDANHSEDWGQSASTIVVRKYQYDTNDPNRQLFLSIAPNYKRYLVAVANIDRFPFALEGTGIWKSGTYKPTDVAEGYLPGDVRQKNLDRFDQALLNNDIELPLPQDPPVLHNVVDIPSLVSHPDEIRVIQAFLIEKFPVKATHIGNSAGKPDGLWGPGSRRAFQHYLTTPSPQGMGQSHKTFEIEVLHNILSS